MADQERLVSLATVFRSHAGGAVGHFRHGEADCIGAFLEQPPDIGGRDVAFDEIAVDLARVTGDHLLRDTVVEFVADKQSGSEVFESDNKPIAFKDAAPGCTASASRSFADMDGRRALGGAQTRCEDGEACSAHKQGTAGQYWHD